MSLREQLKAKNATLIKRRIITLPDSGIEVQVRGLMLGELHRITDAKGTAKQTATQIGLCLEDPVTGVPVYNVGSQEDINEIHGYSINDGTAVVNTSNELSGIGKAAIEEGKEISTPEKSSNTSSLSDSTPPSES